jgi:hypothetical protein
MNISHEHKMIWFSPEMSGTENVSKTLEKHGFLGIEGKTELELLSEYPNYKVICGMKNPYERVFLLHLKGDLRSIQLKKHHFVGPSKKKIKMCRGHTSPSKKKKKCVADIPVPRLFLGKNSKK